MAASGMTQSVAYFESLGGDAEFAVVQRRCGVRAAGVLAHARHGGIAVLIRLLDAGFAGLFDHGNLSLTDQDELHDQHYDVRMPRAVAAPGAAPAPASDAALLHLLLRAEAEVQGRAAATLARLTAGGTIFVLKATTPPDAEAVRALLASLRRFGDNALLLVRPGSAPLVARAEPNVYTGNMTAFAYGADVLEGIRVAEWEALCRATLRLHAPPRPAAPAPLPVPPPRPDTVAPLANAVRLHRDGNLDAAGAAYQALLNANPGHADALHLLGLVRDAQGQAEQALALIAKAIARKSSPRFFANQGVILGRIGRLDDAVAAHRQALALQPDYPEALNNLGMALAALARPEEAAAAHRRAIELRPDYAEARLNLGHALGLLGDLPGAEAAFRAAFAQKPALAPAPLPSGARKLLCVAADGSMPGAVYRCAHLAEAAAVAGWQARWLPLAEVREGDLHGLHALLVWRGELTGPVCRMVAYVRAYGARVGLDLDDLICEPDLARAEVIDGIRTLGADTARLQAQFRAVKAMLHAADFATASTPELAARMRRPGLPVWTLPNGFDATTLHAARTAVRARRRAPPAEVLRIGYAAGTRTHQRDMRPLAPALAAVLRARPQARLVVFRDMLAVDEFPDLAALANRIEWRDLVPLRQLPRELARFDINLAPVEVGNPFAEAKSELKYFEAALAGVPTIASPTGPFRRAIRHGRTGLLADTPDPWEAALLALIDDPALRARLAEAAYHDALWRFGPQRRAARVGAMLAELGGGPDAARAFAADVVHPPVSPDTPEVPTSETLFDADDGQDSRVTIVVTSAGDGPDAIRSLASVREQTLLDIDLVVVDDGADAASVQRAAAWLHAHAGRFHRTALRLVAPEGGPGAARNVGFAWAETAWVLPLAAGPRLRPSAAEALLAAADRENAAFAFAAPDGPAMRYEPRRLQSANPVGPMALVAKWAWAAAGGYAAGGDAAYGLWCRFAELGLHGGPVAEPLLHDAADPAPSAAPDTLRRRHPWLAALPT